MGCGDTLLKLKTGINIVQDIQNYNFIFRHFFRALKPVLDAKAGNVRGHGRPFKHSVPNRTTSKHVKFTL